MLLLCYHTRLPTCSTAPHWNVASCPLCCSPRAADLLVRRKEREGGRHYRQWMNSVIQKAQFFLSCKLRELDAERRADTFLSDSFLRIQTPVQWEWEQPAGRLLLMSPAHLDSILFSVRNLFESSYCMFAEDLKKFKVCYSCYCDAGVYSRCLAVSELTH